MKNPREAKIFQAFSHFDMRGVSSTTHDFSMMEKHGVPHHFSQQYVSSSKLGVLRGMHYQPKQGKLLCVLAGRIQDVIINNHCGSSNFRTPICRIMEPFQSLWIPSGYMHGFLALDDTLMEYLYDIPYDDTQVITYAWDSPQLEIPWLLQKGELPILSKKDAEGIYLENE